MSEMKWQLRLKDKLASKGVLRTLRTFVSVLIVALTATAVAMTVNLLFDQKYFISSGQLSPSYKSQYFSMADSYIASLSDPAGLEDGLFLVFSSLNRESEGQLTDYGYSNLLEDYIVRLISDDTPNSEQHTAELMSILTTEKEEEPFAGLPSESRRLFTNLSSSITSGDQDTAQSNLSDIALQMATTTSVISGLRAQNDLMLGLAVAGLGMTIIMGMGALVVQIRRRKLQR